MAVKKSPKVKASKSAPTIRPREATEIDRGVGERIRLARKIVGMSQTELGERSGVTFQQIQKYEGGMNRVSASRLFEFAKVLQKPISYFFPDEANEHSDDETYLRPLTKLNPKVAKRILTALDESDAKTRDKFVGMLDLVWPEKK